jgi:hypothetical protein
MNFFIVIPFLVMGVGVTSYKYKNTKLMNGSILIGVMVLLTAIGKLYLTN